MAAQENKVESNWITVLPFEYHEYNVDEGRKRILFELEEQFLRHMQNSVDSCLNYNHWPDGVHLDETINQSDNQKWFDYRKFRITASIFYDFMKNPYSILNKFWDFTKVPNTKAILYGKENEQNALNDIEKELGVKIDKCGLFLSKSHPFIGATPDGLIGKHTLVEVKCPYILKDSRPDDFDSLKSSQKYAYFCEKTSTGIRLKRSHKYYFQVQCQMFTTGVKRTKFCV